MANKVVSDTGPILHLSEVNLLKIINIFKPVIIPEEVEKELIKNNIDIPRSIAVIKINPESKDTVKILTNQYDLDLGEAEAIALVLQEKAAYFLTDDLEARQVSKEYGIEVHGTVGIVLRAFREKIIDKKIALEKIKELKASSLFITQDLIDEVMKAIGEFRY